MSTSNDDGRGGPGLSRRGLLRRLLATTALSAAAGGGLLSLAPRPAAAAAEIDLSGVVLRVGVFQEVTLAQVKMTEYFEHTPYKIEWAVLNGAGPTMQALGGRAIDLSWGLSDTAAPKASAEDREAWTAETAPLKWIALLEPVDSKNHPSGVIVANAKSGITSLEGLRGRTYAYNEGGNAEARALLALHKAGLKKSDVQIRLLSNNALASALISGAVDASVPTFETIADAVDDGTLKVLATQEEVGFPGYTSITAHVEAVNDPKRGAAIADFLTRVTRFSEYRAQNLDKFAVAFVKSQQLTEKQALAAVYSSSTRVIPIGEGTPGLEVERNLLKLLNEIGFLTRPVDALTVTDGRYTRQIEAARAAGP